MGTLRQSQVDPTGEEATWNEIVGTLIVERLKISHGYCKPFILSPMLSGFYPCYCIETAVVSHQNQVSRSSGLFSLLLSPNMVDGFPLKHCLHFACRSSLYVFPSLSFLAILSFTLLFLTSEQWHIQNSALRPFVFFTYTNSSRHAIQLHFCKYNLYSPLETPLFWSASLALHVLLPEAQ